MSYAFFPMTIVNLWNAGNNISIYIGIKIIITGFISVLISMFILTPIILRNIKLANNIEISLILEKIARQMKFEKTPNILMVKTAQINAISFNLINKKSIGLTTGFIEALQENQFNKQELECIFAYLLSYHSNQYTIKRYFMYGIVALYSSLGYIFIFLARGFYRLAEMTEQRGYRIFILLLGFLCIIAATLLRIPEKIGSIFAFPLIYSFQRKADSVAKKFTNQEILRNVLHTISENNKNITKRLNVLPNPEYWFVKPVNLFWIDKIFLFRIPLNKRIQI